MTVDNVDRVTTVPGWVDDLLIGLSCAPSRRIASTVRSIAPCEIDELLAALHDAPGDLPEADLRSHLHHVCLPALADMGMVHLGDQHVRRRDHPGWEARMTEVIMRRDSAEADALIRAVADPTTREVLVVLDRGEEERPLADVGASMTTGDARRRRLSLHHRALPRLDDAGILAYHPEDRLIVYRGDPFVADLLDGLAAVAPNT